jgi:hypothetical protein
LQAAHGGYIIAFRSTAAFNLIKMEVAEKFYDRILSK